MRSAQGRRTTVDDSWCLRGRERRGDPHATPGLNDCSMTDARVVVDELSEATPERGASASVESVGKPVRPAVPAPHGRSRRAPCAVSDLVTNPGNRPDSISRTPAGGTAPVRPMSSAPAHNERVRVLVVEDHVGLANRICEGLRDAGFAVDVVYDGAAALQSTSEADYDVIVLDRDLPNVHGDRVCRELVRGDSPARILMLTAATDVEDRVDGLELGADDYLGKPFAFGELIARIRALGRRGPGTPALVQRGDLVVDRARHRASRAGIPLTLTRKEFGVLECLAGADG